MEKMTSYQKLRKKIDYMEFMTKHMLMAKKEDLTGNYEEDQRDMGFISALEFVLEWLHKDEESDN